MRFWGRIIAFWFWLGLSTGLSADFNLMNGDVVRGELADAKSDGIVVRLATGGFSPLIDYAKLTDETLKVLAENPKARRFVEPFLAPPAEEIARLEAKQITVKPPPRVERPEVQRGLVAALRTPVGLFLLGLLFIANLYAAFEIARFRWRPVALVCGLSAVLPVIAPIIFLVLPKPTVHEAPSPEAGEGASVPMAASSAESRVGAMGLVKHDKPGGGTEGVPRVFPRGEFTFNKRFFETQFPSFFRVVPSDADRDLVIDINAGRASAVATRISRITGNELHIKNQVGKEVPVSFADITGVTLRHKDQKT